MSLCVEKLPHSTDTCSSSDGLQVFLNDDNTYSGYCFACGTYVPDPYEGRAASPAPVKKIKTPEEIAEEMAEINALPSHPLPSRLLRKETLEHFGIKVAVSEQDGTTPAIAFYPATAHGEIIAYRARMLAAKKMWWVGAPKNKDIDLIGWRQAIESGARKLFIVTGDNDMAALWQALKDKQRGTQWEALIPAVVSIPHGDGYTKHVLSRMASEINRNFKEVVLVFDQDQSGQAAVAEAQKILPQATTATIPAKDANQCLIEGKALALCNAVLFKASVAKNTRLVWGSALHDAARVQPVWGLSWPWEGMTKLTRGLRLGETIYLGAGVKMGKSELVNSLAAHLVTEHGMKVFLAKPEEANRKTYQMMCGKVAGKVFHDPEKEFDFDAYDKASAVLRDNVCVLNLYQHVDWSTLRVDILQAIHAGCKAVFIDPITNTINGVAAGEANTVLQTVAQDLAAIAKDHEILAFIFCHLKAPESGAPHERGGKVFSHQFAGSRAMMRSCHMMIGLEGNKDPDLQEEERNMRQLILLEDREFGSTGIVPLYWDSKTGIFSEVQRSRR